MRGVLLFAVLILPQGLRAEDWPQFLGPTRNGVSPDSTLTNAWPKEGPPQRWQKKVGAGFSGPVVAQGKVILFHRLADRETVECWDSKSGQRAWISDYPTTYHDDFGFDEGPRATPAIAQGRVFTLGAAGQLQAWNLATGEKQWSVDTQKVFSARKGYFGIACSPLVEGDLVLLNVGGTDGAGIVAFEASTGKVRWKASHAEASYSSPVAATIHGRRLALFFTREGLTVLDPKDGKITSEFPWRPPIAASVNAATPLVIDDLIFLSASYGLGAVLLQYRDSKIERIWASDDVLSNHYSTSVALEGFLYGFDGRQEQGCRLCCVELKTGRSRWTEEGLGAGTVTLAGHQLLVLTEKGELIRAKASPSGFKPDARAQILPFLARAYPALAEGCLYARSKDKLVCVDLRHSP